METAKIFSNGGSQAVRLPKQYRFNSEEVIINKIGNAIVLIAKKDLAKEYRKGLEILRDENFLQEGIPESIPSTRDISPGLQIEEKKSQP